MDEDKLNLVPVDEDPFGSMIRCVSHHNKDGKDMISSLIDDDLALEILSLLPTNYSVQAGTWSSRWRNLWTYGAVIDLDDTKHHNFKDLVNGVLNFLNPLVKRKFTFTFSKEYDLVLVDAWLDAAIRLGATEIKLHVQNWEVFELPEHISTNKSLTTLKLNIDGHLKVSSFVCLPTVKTLHLNLRGFADQGSVENLFCNSPVLEELIINSRPWEKLEVVYISCPMLKHLFIHDPLLQLSQCTVVVDAPKLVSFKYDGHFAMSYSLEDPPLLMDAYIDLDYSRISWDIEHVPRVTRLLQAVSSVTEMKLTDHTMLAVFFAVNEYPYILPTFYNLKMLEVTGIAASNCVRSLLCLLNNTPSLEILVFAAKFFNMEDKHLYAIVPECLQFNLKNITINNFHGHSDDIEFIEYFAKNAKVLDKLSVICSNKLARSEKRMDVYNEVLSLPMASKRGNIFFS